MRTGLAIAIATLLAALALAWMQTDGGCGRDVRVGGVQVGGCPR